MGRNRFTSYHSDDAIIRWQVGVDTHSRYEIGSPEWRRAFEADIGQGTHQLAVTKAMWACLDEDPIDLVGSFKMRVAAIVGPLHAEYIDRVIGASSGTRPKGRTKWDPFLQIDEGELTQRHGWQAENSQRRVDKPPRVKPKKGK